jgi:hypothetical protein
MKTFILAAAVSSLALAAAPAFAQDATPRTAGFYGNLGYSHLDPMGSEVNAITGRVGGRFMNYLGVEGEATFGLGHSNDQIGSLPVQTQLGHSVAGYVVGFLPVSPNLDVFARVGYGNSHINRTYGGTPAPGSLAGTYVHTSVDSVNYGAGAQYFFTPTDGLRGEYTRNDYRDNLGHANVWSLSYVRRF